MVFPAVSCGGASVEMSFIMPSTAYSRRYSLELDIHNEGISAIVVN